MIEPTTEPTQGTPKPGLRSISSCMWEYKIEQASIADKWSANKQGEELANLLAKLNQNGAQGWEMVSYESVPIYGAFSSSLKEGYAYLLFFKRRMD